MGSESPPPRLSLKRAFRSNTQGAWLTSCGRFCLLQVKGTGREEWRIGTVAEDETVQTLRDAGLLEGSHLTRKAALQRLEDALRLIV